jgi:hypothetical protein
MHALLDEFVSFGGGMGHIARNLVMLAAGTDIKSRTTKQLRELLPRYPLYGSKMRTDAVDCRLLAFVAE